MKFNLKVQVNKANGQARVALPKRMLRVVPKNIEVWMPDEIIKQKALRRNLW